MIKEYGVIEISEKNENTGYVDVCFFVGVNTDVNGGIEILTTTDPCKAMHIQPLPFDTIGGSRIKNLIEFINKATFKSTYAEFKTFKVEIL